MEDNHKDHDRGYAWFRPVIVVLVGLLVLLGAYFVHAYMMLRREHVIQAREISIAAFVRKHGPLTADETGIIRSWMTFAYVNQVFALPPDVLKDAFRIDDKRYPQMTVERAAAEQGTDPVEFVIQVQAAVTAYLHEH